jgi:glycine cleavage system pyridoxal-binding protein P
MRRRELLLAGAGALLARPAVAAAAATLDENGDVIKALIAREEGAQFAYRGAVPRGAPDLAATARAHAAALRTQLQALGRGTAPISADALDPLARRLAEASTARARLDAAIALETDLVSTYRTAVVKLTEPGILQTVATILACHAQQRALLARLAGRDPFQA